MDFIVFLCHQRLFIVDDSSYATHFVSYLNNLFDYEEQTTHRDFRHGCQKRFLSFSSIFSESGSINQNFTEYVKILIPPHGDVASIYYYSANQHTSNFFKAASLLEDEEIKLKLHGCLILAEGSAGGRPSFNFTSLQIVKSRVGKGMEKGSQKEICLRFIDFLKSQSKIPGLISSEIRGQRELPNGQFGREMLLWFSGVDRIFVDAVKSSAERVSNVVGSFFSFSLFSNHDAKPSRPEWMENIQLAMDENGTTHRYKDVYTTVSLWGHPDAAAEFETIRFSKMTERLETAGYVPGLSIRAAPYDFRKAPNENEAFCPNFKQLIEDTYVINNNKKVVLLAHSMGNMYTLYCLNRLSQDWKDKYIKSFICIAAPWGGSPYAIKFIARGEAEGLEFSRDHLVDVARSWPSLLYLLPHENFFDKDFPFIRTPTKNYTIQDYEQLFIDLNMPKAIPAYRKIKNLTSHMVPPRVEVHCMYGYGFSTEGWYTYTENDFPHGSSFGRGMQDGDAVVTVNSANACTRWSKDQLQPVTSSAYRSPHPDLILNDTLINHVKEILFEKR